jgi:hypothetical protein
MTVALVSTEKARRGPRGRQYLLPKEIVAAAAAAASR